MTIQKLIVSILDNGPADPREVAYLVDQQTTDTDVRDYYRACLPSMVRDVIRGQRRGTPLEAIDPKLPQSASSVKRAAIREAWREQLNDRYAVPGPDGTLTWKFLRDMTRPDVLATAQMRRVEAKRNEAKARYLDAIAAVMAEAGVKQVGALPEPALRRVADVAA